MRLFLSLLLLFVMASCSTIRTPKVVKAPVKEMPPFMTKDQVFAAVKNFVPEERDGELTDEEKRRLGNLTWNKSFADENRAMILNQRKKDRAEKSAKSISHFTEPDEVDLRFRDTPVKSQDNGKCTAFGGTAAMENLINKPRIIEGLDLSEQHAWKRYGEYSSTKYMRAMRQEANKIADDKYYPQYGKPASGIEKYAHAWISEDVYIGDNIEKMRYYLAKGYPVYLAMATPTQMYRCNKTINTSTSDTGGGHALELAGYYKKDGKTIGIIKNSWGDDCGDYGYQYMDMDVCFKSDFYCSMWAILEVKSKYGDGTEPIPPEPKLDPVYEEVCKRIWWKPWAYRCWDECVRNCD